MVCNYSGMFLGILVISITCVFDDIFTIKPIVKLIGQVLAAIVAVAFGVRIESIDFGFINTSELGEVVSIIVTIIWIVGGNKCNKLNRTV